jgi:cysteine-rich repeat protein
MQRRLRRTGSGPALPRSDRVWLGGFSGCPGQPEGLRHQRCGNEWIPGGAPTPPFTPASANANPDEAILNLLTVNPITTTEPFYPLSSRLYVSTLYGFGHLLGGEKELARCFANNANLGPSMSEHSLVPIPGGVQCVDYRETSANTIPPPANVRGVGNVGLAGCGTLGTEHNSCLVRSEAPDICGDGVVTPDEASDQGLNDGCDDGNTVSGDGCSANCTIEAGFACNGSPSVCIIP